MNFGSWGIVRSHVSHGISSIVVRVQFLLPHKNKLKRDDKDLLGRKSTAIEGEFACGREIPMPTLRASNNNCGNNRYAFPLLRPVCAYPLRQ